MINETYGNPTSSTFDATAIRRTLDQDGYVIARDAIPLSDIEELRRSVELHLGRDGVRLRLGRTQPDAAARIPELSRAFAHPEILRLVTGILGRGSTVFTRHCDAHMNMISGWHKDSGESVEGGYFRGNYFEDETCRVYKIALYLQDCGPKSGLTVVPGSHRDPTVSSAGAVHLPTRAGDAVLFDVRLTHTGQLPDPVERALMAATKAVMRMPFRAAGQRSDEPSSAYAARQTYWKLIGRSNRLSIFFTFGAANQYTFDFAEANLRRQERQASLNPIPHTEDAISRLTDALTPWGVRVYGVNLDS